MIVTEVGSYKLLQDYVTRGSISVGTTPKGTVIQITGIDKEYHKVISDSFFDWHYWDLPVERIN